MRKAHLVFIPSPGVGHLFSAVELAKRLVGRDDRLSITFFIMKFPFDKQTPPFSSTQSIKFVYLSLEDSSAELLSSKPAGIMYSELIEIQKPRVRDFISSEVDQLSAFLVDMFCTSFIDLANDFKVPTYAYFPSNIGFLGLLFHLQTLQDNYNKEIADFKDSDVELNVPGFVNLVPAKVLPPVVIDKERGFPNFLDIPRRLRETKGILVNTYEELETRAIKFPSSDDKIPPISPVGPLLTATIKFDDTTQNDGQTLDIMSWLENQPQCSVLLLCFGSMGTFESEQVVEIAQALERSGHRFLWALRRPPPKNGTEIPRNYENLKDVLPEGFLDRTASIGKVIGWAPQAMVLSHPAVGGFVSHCGWNSILESLWCGVPIATWPLYAEQRINAFQLVKELGLAVEIRTDYDENSVVTADEIESGIRRLMDEREGSEIREKVKEMREKSRLALESGGSSYNAMGRFIEDLLSTSS